jgi:DNA-binding NtrC family response regulator
MEEQARILVIDDDSNVRKILSMMLTKAGYLVDVAETGEKAIAKSNANYYNLALIDVRLPDMVGTKLLSLLSKTVPRMMKVILTGYPMMDNAMDAINRGVDGYLIKPVNTEQLLSMVKYLLTKQAEEQEFTEQQVTEYVKSRFKYGRTIRKENKLKIVRRELPI